MALYKRGNIWWCSFTAANGKRIRCSAGTTDKKDAQQFFDKLKHESWRVNFLGAKPRHTWDEAALQWLKEKAHKKSLHSDISMLRVLTPIWRGRYLEDITREDIARIGEERKQAASPARANRYLALIRSIFIRAVRIWGWLEKAPTVILYKEPKRRVRFLHPDELARLILELPEHLKPVVAFAVLTGLRKGNIINLRWSQVDLMNDVIIISGSEMKNGRDHCVPLTETTRSIIAEQLGKHPEFVFTYRGKPVKNVSTRAFREALKRAGIKDYRFHDNRHTWASALVQNGVSLYELQEMGGWQSAEMVKRYAHLDPRQFRNNAEIADKVLAPFGANLPHSQGTADKRKAGKPITH